MTASRIPALEDAMVSIITSVLPGVTIIQGPAVARQVTKADLATVSTPSELFESTASGTRTQAGYGSPAQESLALVCGLSSSSGGADAKARRDRVAAMLTAVDDALRDDPTLGGVVAWAWITEERWDYRSDGQGVACDLTYVVSARGML